MIGSVLRGVFVLGGCILSFGSFLLLNGCGGSDTPDPCDCEAGTPEYNAALDPDNLYLAEVVTDEWNPQSAGSQRKNWICSADNGLAATDENGMPIQNNGALGPPEGEGIFEGGGTYTCVGIDGSAAWKFEEGRYIYNGEGIDFITFSSNFAWSTAPDSLCCELAHVEVSADGETWYKNSAEDFVPNPDPPQDNGGFAYRSVSGLHGNNPTWANWKKQMQAQKIEEVDGTEQWADIPCECISIYFEPDDPYVVQRIVRQSPAWHHAETIEPGDRLVRVNGTDVDPANNRESYFTAPSGDEEITLAFERGRTVYEIKMEPANYFSIRNLMYDEWMDERQSRVDEASDERIAYVHMKNMGGGELQHFKEEMVSEGKQRDALILDLRYNTGGNVHDEVLRFLSQRPYLNWGYREGELATQSNFTPAAKPIVMLINQQSLSDAEMTAAGFRELGLGTLIGMETYRWIIFTSGRSLVDGSFYRLPSWGVYTLDGENLERTGVSPDIQINNTFFHRMNNDDPQLDRAIRYIMEQL